MKPLVALKRWQIQEVLLYFRGSFHGAWLSSCDLGLASKLQGSLEGPGRLFWGSGPERSQTDPGKRHSPGQTFPAIANKENQQKEQRTAYLPLSAKVKNSETTGLLISPCLEHKWCKIPLLPPLNFLSLVLA